jgi:TPR repeat protein
MSLVAQLDGSKLPWLLLLAIAMAPLAPLGARANTYELEVEGYEAFQAENYARALELFQQACDGGGSYGCHMIGHMFDQGTGGAAGRCASA